RLALSAATPVGEGTLCAVATGGHVREVLAPDRRIARVIGAGVAIVATARHAPRTRGHGRGARGCGRSPCGRCRYAHGVDRRERVDRAVAREVVETRCLDVGGG